MNPSTRRGALASTTAFALLALAGVLVALHSAVDQPAAPQTSCPAPAEIEERIKFYSDQVAAKPRLYPTLALLGKAYLDRVRWTGDPRDLAAARDALKRSIDIQPNFVAYKVSAAVGNYSHRFADALHWCDLAAGTAPDDVEILAMRTEALLALDRPNEVVDLLGKVDRPGEQFHIVACRGTLAAAREDRTQALSDFERAARLARVAKSPDLEIWCHVASAALFLDHGQPAKAEPWLHAAEKIDSDDYDLQVHLAEFDAGTGREPEALTRYERLLTRRCDAEVHRQAYLLASRLGQQDKAARHYAAAEQLWKAALDQGEVYPLEGLAKLYCDAGRHRDEALELARRNLAFKRDASARETLERAQSLPTNR